MFSTVYVYCMGVDLGMDQCQGIGELSSSIFVPISNHLAVLTLHNVRFVCFLQKVSYYDRD